MQDVAAAVETPLWHCTTGVLTPAGWLAGGCPLQGISVPLAWQQEGGMAAVKRYVAQLQSVGTQVRAQAAWVPSQRLQVMAPQQNGPQLPPACSTQHARSPTPLA